MRDASEMVTDVPLENALNMHSVWTAWFHFRSKQDLLRTDVLFFCNILNKQHSSAASSGFNWIGLQKH